MMMTMTRLAAILAAFGLAVSAAGCCHHGGGGGGYAPACSPCASSYGGYPAYSQAYVQPAYATAALPGATAFAGIPSANCECTPGAPTVSPY